MKEGLPFIECPWAPGWTVCMCCLWYIKPLKEGLPWFHRLGNWGLEDPLGVLARVLGSNATALLSPVWWQAAWEPSLCPWCISSPSSLPPSPGPTETQPHFPFTLPPSQSPALFPHIAAFIALRTATNSILEAVAAIVAPIGALAWNNFSKILNREVVAFCPLLAGTLRSSGFPRALGSSQSDLLFQCTTGWDGWASYCLRTWLTCY